MDEMTKCVGGLLYVCEHACCNFGVLVFESELVKYCIFGMMSIVRALSVCLMLHL